MIEMVITVAKVLAVFIGVAVVLLGLTSLFCLAFVLVIDMIFSIKELLHNFRMKKLKRKFDLIGMKARIEDEYTSKIVSVRSDND